MLMDGPSIIELLRSVPPTDAIAIIISAQASETQCADLMSGIGSLTRATLVASVEEPTLYTEPLALRVALVSGVWTGTVIRNRRGPVGLKGKIFDTRAARAS